MVSPTPVTTSRPLGGNVVVVVDVVVVVGAAVVVVVVVDDVGAAVEVEVSAASVDSTNSPLSGSAAGPAHDAASRAQARMRG